MRRKKIRSALHGQYDAPAPAGPRECGQSDGPVFPAARQGVSLGPVGEGQAVQSAHFGDVGRGGKEWPTRAGSGPTGGVEQHPPYEIPALVLRRDQIAARAGEIARLRGKAAAHGYQLSLGGKQWFYIC